MATAVCTWRISLRFETTTNQLMIRFQRHSPHESCKRGLGAEILIGDNRKLTHCRQGQGTRFVYRRSGGLANYDLTRREPSRWRASVEQPPAEGSRSKFFRGDGRQGPANLNVSQDVDRVSLVETVSESGDG